jgi:hypothetical protein
MKKAIAAVSPFVLLGSGALANAVPLPENALEAAAPVPFVFRFSDHALVASSRDFEDATIPDQNTLLHENQLEAAYGALSTAITFTNQFALDGNSGETRPFRLEKKRVTWKPGAFELTAGDVYHQFGRGIALATYRDPVFGLDTTVEGGHLQYRGEKLDVTAFAGRLNAFSVPVAVNPVSNPLAGRSVTIVGAAASYDLGVGRLGFHAASTWVRPQGAEIADRQFRVAGGTYEGSFADSSLDVYLESNVLVTDFLTRSIFQPTGYGSYGVIAWTGQGWRVKFEGKDYRKFFYDFRRPPTMEEDTVLTLNTQDVSAVKALFEQRVGDGRSSVWASVLAADDRIVRAPIVHGVVGTKWKIGRRGEVEVRSGYRDEIGKNDLLHGMVRSKIPTWTSESIEISYRKLRGHRGLDLAEPTVDDRNFVDVGYNLTERWNLAVGYEYVPSNPEASGAHFANASLNYRQGGFAGRLFVGRTSGGPQCSAGICRLFPPFSGALAETTITF